MDENCKRHIPLLPTFHWPGLVKWPHKAAKEAGKCHLAVYAGGKENRFGEQRRVSARALPTGHQIPVSLFPPHRDPLTPCRRRHHLSSMQSLG